MFVTQVQLQLLKEDDFSQDEQKRRMARLQDGLAAQLELYLTEGQMAQWKKSVAKTVQSERKPAEGADTKRQQQSDAMGQASQNSRNRSLQDNGVLESSSPGVAKSGVY